MATGAKVLIHGLWHIVTKNYLDLSKGRLRADGHNAFDQVLRKIFHEVGMCAYR